MRVPGRVIKPSEKTSGTVTQRDRIPGSKSPVPFQAFSGWWQLKYFLDFSPRKFGEGDSHFDEHSFQRDGVETTNQFLFGSCRKVHHPNKVINPRQKGRSFRVCLDLRPFPGEMPRLSFVVGIFFFLNPQLNNPIYAPYMVYNYLHLPLKSTMHVGIYIYIY